MKAACLVADIDGTLGGSIDEIRAGLVHLRNLPREFDLCLVTGRTLVSLRTLVPFIRPGTLVSPWGGGNILRCVPSGYEPVWPLTPLRYSAALPGFSLTFVPKSLRFSDLMEITCAAEAVAPPITHVCVGGFREVDKHFCEPPIGRRHLGLSGTQWDLVAPWIHPRRRLVRQIRCAGSKWVAYWGDDKVDVQALSGASVVMAPEASSLANDSRVHGYCSIAEAMLLTCTLACDAGVL